MAFNGSGVFSLYSPGNPVVTNTTISSSWANNTLSDIATGLSTAVCKDGQTTTTARVPFASGISNGSQTLTAVASGTATTHAATVGQLQSSASKLIGTVAGTNTITGVVSPALTAYAAGQVFAFTPAATNTGATTINIDSVGAKNIFMNGAACVGGELRISIPVLIEYDGTQFHIIGNGSVIPVPGSAGSVPMSRTGATAGIAYVPALNKAIYGLTYANNVGDPTNDIDFAAGGCMDSTGAFFLTCAALTKRLDANWAAGTNQGMRNSAAAIADTDYYLWAVATATGTQDYYAHTSSVAATVLTALQAEVGGSSYAFLRLIGWIKRVGGTIVAFTSYETEGGGFELNWNVPTLDVNLANTLTTTRRTDAVKVPLNFSVLVNINVQAEDASSSHSVLIYNPDMTDAAPSLTVAPLATMGGDLNANNTAVNLTVRTSATGTIAARASIATVDLYAVVTLGFRWARRN